MTVRAAGARVMGDSALTRIDRMTIDVAKLQVFFAFPNAEAISMHESGRRLDRSECKHL